MVSAGHAWSATPVQLSAGSQTSPRARITNRRRRGDGVRGTRLVRYPGAALRRIANVARARITNRRRRGDGVRGTRLVRYPGAALRRIANVARARITNRRRRGDGVRGTRLVRYPGAALRRIANVARARITNRRRRRRWCPRDTPGPLPQCSSPPDRKRRQSPDYKSVVAAAMVSAGHARAGPLTPVQLSAGIANGRQSPD